MLGVGLPELILIFVVALIVIGPERMPEMAKTLAKAYVQIRRAGDEITQTIREADRSGARPEQKSYAAKGALRPETGDSESASAPSKEADAGDAVKRTPRV
ncbi:MAG: twin-arginine translocase TatA/TatE family subunit [Deltaproteobacteria bacterium]|nr:twin-arginine translocase TatA/TatE family subunit [Deltaproteobacteria bacterium]